MVQVAVADELTTGVVGDVRRSSSREMETRRADQHALPGLEFDPRMAKKEARGSGSEHPSAVIGLVDLVYGAVLAYGFEHFAEGNQLRAAFAFAFVGVDWLASHRVYRGRSDERLFVPVFFCDLGLLFAMSRLFTFDAFDSFWQCMAVIFVLYVVWDSLLAYQFVEANEWRVGLGHMWRDSGFKTSIIADVVVAAVLLGFVYFRPDRLLGGGAFTVSTDLLLMAICGGAVTAWFIDDGAASATRQA
jgi:hypothetical protein